MRKIINKLTNTLKPITKRILSVFSSPQATYYIGEPFFWLMGMRYKGREIDLSQVERVLVVRLDEIGDVVMTTPFLRELRKNLPKAWITLIVKPAVYDLVELCPYVNEVLTFDWNTEGSFKKLKKHLKALWLAWRHLWKRRFDLAILPRWDVDYYHSTFVAYFSGASFRIGYSENVNSLKKRLNNGFDHLLTHQLNNDILKHEIERSLDVIRFLGREVEDTQLEELWLEDKDELFTDKILKCHNIQSNDFLIGLAPGARGSKRCWPINQFIKLGNWDSVKSFMKSTHE